MQRDLKAELAGIGMGILGLVLFIWIVEEVDRFEEPDELTAFDAIVADWMAGHVSGGWFVAGLFLAQVGSVVVVGPLVLGASVFSWTRGRRLEAVMVALGAVLLQLLVMVLKRSFGRARPDVGLVAEPGLSFPSGHAAFGAYLAMVLVWVAFLHVRRHRVTVVLLALAIAWALLQAFGRVLIGVHFVSDVLAGLGLGLAVGGFGLAAAPFGGRLVQWWRGLVSWARSEWAR